MIYPKVNINGTSAADLQDQYVIAWRAIREAIEAVADATPHGRDYQLNPDEYQGARDEHYERIVKLKAVEQELFDIALNVSEQEK